VRKRKEDAPRPGAPLWQVTYGDMVTLVLTFFVLLYAFSSVDAKKYIQISNSLRGALGGNVGVLNTGITLEDIGDVTSSSPAQQMYERLQKILNTKGLEGKVELLQTREGIVISFKERLFFKIASADILEEAYPVLDEVGAILKENDFPIRVEGHSCDLPISNYRFPSNWELSSIRAVNVTKYLIDRIQVPPEQLSVAAYGPYRPLVPNTSEENRGKNRRVDIIIQTN